MRYQVTWGDESRVVEADNEAEAWCAFVDHNDEATKFPNLHARTIAVVEDVVLDEPEPVVAPVVEVEAEDDTDVDYA